MDGLEVLDDDRVEAQASTMAETAWCWLKVRRIWYVGTGGKINREMDTSNAMVKASDCAKGGRETNEVGMRALVRNLIYK